MTGTLTVAPSPITTGHQELAVQQNDTIVNRYKADAANTGNPTQITDSGCQNMIYANGMTPGAQVACTYWANSQTYRAGQIRHPRRIEPLVPRGHMKTAGLG